MPAARTLRELPRWAAALLRDTRVAHLGLIDDKGRPRVLPVTFALHDDAIWSAVDDKPKRRPGDELAREHWLRARPQSTITVDRYDDDWTRLAWVQIIGSTSITETHGDVIAALAARYEQYRDRPPRGPLLRLTPERIVYWKATEVQ
jgi:PPOX class probable F420-dependent enzyme